MPPDVPLSEFPFRPLPSTCASRIAHVRRIIQTWIIHSVDPDLTYPCLLNLLHLSDNYEISGVGETLYR